MRVVVIGGGPAGMLAAIGASKKNNEVIILEKMENSYKSREEDSGLQWYNIDTITTHYLLYLL